MKTEILYHLFQKHPKVITDSRKIERGCLFFALKGERFNGNKYAAQAIEEGAAYAIIDEKKYQKDNRFLLVENVLVALQKLATYHRRQFLQPVLAITGSNGKTTTKELISSILNNHYKCHFTKGNLNNHIGVPLTLLELELDSDIAVIEMGANHVGEIKILCEIAEPTHGVITNIGKAHLEGFGGIEGVKKGKSELYKFLEKNNGIAFVNTDEAYLTELSNNVKKVLYKKSDHPDIDNAPYETVFKSANPFVEIGFLSKKDNLETVQTQLLGKYNFNNIMTAIAIGRYFRVPFQKIKEALENYKPTNNRSQIVEKDSNTFILDAYNANPTSMKNALENFSKLKATPKIAVLGDMLELGEYSVTEHLQILNQAKSLGIQQIVLVGSEFKKVIADSDLHFQDVHQLKEWFLKQDFHNSHFLIKGSRGIQLEAMLK